MVTAEPAGRERPAVCRLGRPELLRPGERCCRIPRSASLPSLDVQAACWVPLVSATIHAPTLRVPPMVQLAVVVGS